MVPRRVGVRLGCAVVVVAGLLVGAACGSDTSAADKAKAASETLQKGLNAHVAGNLKEAEKDYRKVIADDDQNAFAYYNLALVEQTTGRPTDAEKHYRRALVLDPKMTSALFNLAILRTQAGATDEARQLYTRVIALDPKNAGAHLNLGFLLQDQNQDKEAQQEFKTAVRIDPSLKSRIPAGTDRPTGSDPSG